MSVLRPAVFAWLAAMLLVLQGCAPAVYYPPRGAQPPVVEQGTQAPVARPLPVPQPDVAVPQAIPVPAPIARPQSPAVVALLDTAEQQANSGDLESAAASLERAIRIDSRNPALWYHLATVRLSQGDAPVAEQLAVKSNSLSSGNIAQQVRNWQLIARARRAQNNPQGAAAAEQYARTLGGN